MSVDFRLARTSAAPTSGEKTTRFLSYFSFRPDVTGRLRAFGPRETMVRVLPNRLGVVISFREFYPVDSSSESIRLQRNSIARLWGFNTPNDIVNALFIYGLLFLSRISFRPPSGDLQISTFLVDEFVVLTDGESYDPPLFSRTRTFHSQIFFSGSTTIGLSYETRGSAVEFRLVFGLFVLDEGFPKHREDLVVGDRCRHPQFRLEPWTIVRRFPEC